jgi:oxygen-dependent protoporphyrinogen oxidase
MLEKKYGSLSAAASQIETQPKENAGRSGFMSLKHGMESLIETLVSKLKYSKIIYNSPITSIGKANGGYKINCNKNVFDADSVILTTPPNQITEFLEGISEEIKHLFRMFTFSSSHIVSLAYKKVDVKNKMEATGYVVPSNELTPVTASTWTSEKWPGRAPEEFILIRCFFGEEQNNTPANQLTQLAHDTMRELLAINASSPEKYWISHYTHSLPQYKVGHFERLNNLKRFMLLTHPGIFLAGAAYEGVGVPDCIKQGKNVAMSISGK